MRNTNRIVAGVLGLMLLLPSLSFAGTAVGTAAAGQYGARPYKQTFFSSGTFIPRTDMIFITGSGCGSGGAGGHTADPGGGGGGGAAAQAAQRMPTAVTPGTALTITICTAGVGGAAGAVGGTTNLDTTITGLVFGTYTFMGGRRTTNWIGATCVAPQPGTVTNGGAGGCGTTSAGGVTGTGAGAACGAIVNRPAGGDQVASPLSGAAGGGPSSVGGFCSGGISGYNIDANGLASAASGTKGAGGDGGHTIFGQGGKGGSGAVGGNCVGYGGGGGGGAATFAGGNGCPGFVRIEWSE